MIGKLFFCFCFILLGSVANSQPSNSVAYSFVILGCNRIDKADTAIYHHSNPSTANLAQLERTFAEVAVLNPKPDLLFFAGDLVLGYTSDSLILSDELTAWKKIYEHSAAKAAGIALVAIPGNHESQNTSKIATASAERIWLKVMSDYIRGNNGPHADPFGSDSLSTDQSRLTYSFEYKDAHFIIINTDPAGRDWRPPAHWIAADAQKAHSNPLIRHIFAIAHKPAYSWDWDRQESENDGLGKYPANRNMLWDALETNHTEAMLTAHNHVYRAFSPHHKTWMVIAGNGGSKLEKKTGPNERFFGFTLIQVLKNGTVFEKSYGRNFGNSYLDPSPSTQYPTTIRDSNSISW